MSIIKQTNNEQYKQSYYSFTFRQLFAFVNAIKDTNCLELLGDPQYQKS